MSAAYAVIKCQGKQHRVCQGDVIKVDRLEEKNEGDTIEFNEVLLAGEGAAVKVGTPTVAGAKVIAKVVRHSRGPKVVIFKMRRRKGYRNKRGHRQNLTELKIESIS